MYVRTLHLHSCELCIFTHIIQPTFTSGDFMWYFHLVYIVRQDVLELLNTLDLQVYHLMLISKTHSKSTLTFILICGNRCDLTPNFSSTTLTSRRGGALLLISPFVSFFRNAIDNNFECNFYESTLRLLARFHMTDI